MSLTTKSTYLESQTEEIEVSQRSHGDILLNDSLSRVRISENAKNTSEVVSKKNHHYMLNPRCMRKYTREYVTDETTL